MEHGRIIKINEWGISSTYIVVKYGDNYLLLNTTDLNRRDEFSPTINVNYTDLNLNIVDLNISETIENYLEENEIKELDYVPSHFRKGMVLRSKHNGKLYSLIVARNEEKKYKYYILDYETFELTYTDLDSKWVTDEEAPNYIDKNFNVYDFYFDLLKLRFK